MFQRRVLLARIKGEVREVQFCKFMTTIEGSVDPLCRLTESIIQAYRCRRVTMRSRSRVSTISRALRSCPDVKGEGDTNVHRCVEKHVCKLQRYCQDILCYEVGDGFIVLVQVHVASAEAPVRPVLPRPVAHLLCNRQALRVVLHGLAEVPQRIINVPEVPVRLALPRPGAHPLCNCQGLRVVIDGLGKVPKRLVRVAEVRVRRTVPLCRFSSRAFSAEFVRTEKTVASGGKGGRELSPLAHVAPAIAHGAIAHGVMALTTIILRRAWR
jgi:hypothetical protein